MNAASTYTPDTATEAAAYTYLTRSSDGWNLVARYMNTDGGNATVVVGTATEEAVKMYVGRGSMVHDGYVLHATVTVAHTVQSGHTRRPDTAHAVGATWTTEPANRCGASGVHRSYGFARNSNRQASADAAVTCSKCLKRAAKRA